MYAAASKGKKGKKGDKDGKPKRPRTAYLLFAEDCRARLKKTDPGLSFTETSQVVSREWKELTDDPEHLLPEAVVWTPVEPSVAADIEEKIKEEAPIKEPANTEIDRPSVR